MQCPQEHLKTIVYAKFWGANKVYYGELENRELQLTIATSFPGSTSLSRWRGGDPGTTPGTYRYAPREILH